METMGHGWLVLYYLRLLSQGRAHGLCPFCLGDQEGDVTGDTQCVLTGLLGVTVSLGGHTHLIIFPLFLRNFIFTLVEVGFFVCLFLFQLIYYFDP